MPAVAAESKITASIMAHAITREGRHVLVVAQGPESSFVDRVRARWNNRRWNEGKRTWLL